MGMSTLVDAFWNEIIQQWDVVALEPKYGGAIDHDFIDIDFLSTKDINGVCYLTALSNKRTGNGQQHYPYLWWFVINQGKLLVE